MWVSLMSAITVSSRVPRMQSCDTLTRSDLSQGGLVAEFLASQRGSVEVQVLAYTVICEATSSQKLVGAAKGQGGGVTMASVMVRYQCQGGQCPEQEQLFLADCVVLANNTMGRPQYKLLDADVIGMDDMQCQGESCCCTINTIDVHHFSPVSLDNQITMKKKNVRESL